MSPISGILSLFISAKDARADWILCMLSVIFVRSLFVSSIADF